MSYHHGNLREAAVAAAASLLEEGGEAGVSLRSVAEQVGVTHRALYRHFPDRDALMAEVARGTLDALRGELERAGERAAPEGRRAAVVEAYLDFALAYPTTYRQAFTAGFAKRSAHPDLAKAARTLGAHFGALTTGGLNTKDEAIATWGLLHGLVDLYWGGSLRARSKAAARRYILDLVMQPRA